MRPDISARPARRRRLAEAGRRLLSAGVALAFLAPTWGQLSPGPLSAPHGHLDGTLDCLHCHGQGNAMRDRCLACHKAIAWLAAEGRGLHGARAVDECAACHREHAGRDAPLIRFEEGRPERFDHARAGWTLEGKHRALECAKCHRVDLQVSEAARLSKREHRDRSFLGLERECASCHKDVHRRSLGDACGECHDPNAWKPVPGFDHAKSGYPLTGKHLTTACEKCHRAPRALPASVPLRHDECTACHADPHKGRVGPSCSTCHTTDDFHRVTDRSFNHARTRFALEGKHAAVRCDACHRNGSQGAALRPRYARCTDCHADEHGGQLASRPDGVECSRCHRVQGWKPSTFGAGDHAGLAMALKGRHAAIACAACHGPDRKGPRLSPVSGTLGKARVALDLGDLPCASCHVDPHRGRFAAGGANAVEGDCRSCHGVDAFRPSTMNVDVHRVLGFPLRGAHVKVRCERCHEEMKAGRTAGSQPAEPLVFKADRQCRSCHEGPHGAQFAGRRDGGACTGCHGEDAFLPANRFDHDRDARFPLLRSHGRVLCDRCHEKAPSESGKLVAVYTPTTFDCKECHRRTAPSLGNRGGRELPANGRTRR